MVTVSLPARVRNRLGRIPHPGPVQAHDERVPRLRHRVHDLAEQVRRLERRVEELDAEVLDARSQGRRVGEISDLVTELLVSEATRRDPDFQRIVDKYLSE